MFTPIQRALIDYQAYAAYQFADPGLDPARRARIEMQLSRLVANAAYERAWFEHGGQSDGIFDD